MKSETLEMSFTVCMIVFMVVAFFVAMRLMFVITKRLAKVSHGEKRLLKAIKRAALLALLTILCLFCGCVASFCSGYVTVAKDYTTEATVGITSFQGFPIWFNQDAPGIRIGLIPNRIFANGCVWTTIFLFICCGYYFTKTKDRFMILLGIILGAGCVGIVTFLLLTETDPSVPVHVKMRNVIKTITIFADEHNGEFPASLNELTQPTGDDAPPLLKTKDLMDPWGKRIEYERNEGGFTIRASGPDRIMGTEDDITN